MGSRITAAILSQLLAQAIDVCRVPWFREPAGGRIGEELLLQGIAKQAVHSGDRVAYRHRGKGIAVIPPAQRQHPALPAFPECLPVLHGHLHGDLDGYRA